MKDKYIGTQEGLYKRLSLQMRHLQDYFRDLRVNRSERALIQCGEELSLFAFTASFLNLEHLALLSTLGYAFIQRIVEEERKLSNEYLKLLSRILKTLVQLLRQTYKEDEGNFIDGEINRLSLYWEKQDTDLAPILKALNKQLISREEFFHFKSIGLSKDDDFSHGINIPKRILDKKEETQWMTLIHVDLTQQENLQSFSQILIQAQRDAELLLHGCLELPMEVYRARERGLSYYLTLNSSEEPQDWLRQKNIKGRIIRILHRPSQQRPKQNIAEPVPIQETTQVVPQEPRIEKLEVPVMSEEMMASLNALAERSQREEERDYYRQISLGKHKPVKEGRGLSIGFKLILIIALVIAGSLSGMTWLSSYFFLNDVKTRIEQENLDTSGLWAQKTEQDFWGIFNKAQLLILSLGGDQDQELENFFFRKNPEFIYLGVPGGQLGLVNQDFALDMALTQEFIEEVVLAGQRQILDEVKLGSSVEDARIFNLSPYFNRPVSAVAFPYRQGTEPQALVAILDTQTLLGSIMDRPGIKNSFILTQEGRLIAYPDEALLITDPDFSEHPVIKDILNNQGNNKQISYMQMVVDPSTGEERNVAMLGAFTRIPFGQLVFVTEVEEEPVFESVYRIQRRNFYIMMMVLSLSVLIIYFYSKSITNPLGRLVVATKYIERGNYQLPLKVKSRDETGILTRSFMDMSKGLEERERLKDSFGKFVNQELAEMAMQGELKLGGETKEATVFFSDIRAFTSISEKLEPAEVVSFLNEYMTLMVGCVNESGGFVDKYIGDAIMAVWGAPISRGNDDERAINGALMMRQKLLQFNEGRGGDKKPVIRIGCGLNSGPVLAGQIGSDTRMEYTVIGDTVNLASRIEALNKPMGTDILISQVTKERVEGIYHLVPMNAIKVKGKTEPQQIYAVLGRKDDPNSPETLADLRRTLGIQGDFSAIADVEKEEVKYEILA